MSGTAHWTCGGRSRREAIARRRAPSRLPSRPIQTRQHARLSACPTACMGIAQQFGATHKRQKRASGEGTPLAAGPRGIAAHPLFEDSFDKTVQCGYNCRSLAVYAPAGGSLLISCGWPPFLQAEAGDFVCHSLSRRKMSCTQSYKQAESSIR
jgi:hypothetical protein